VSTARFLVGDVYERLAELHDDSVDLVMTSPPFLALRSYLPSGHPDKGREVGAEPNPAAFIDTLLDLTDEWRRVLTPHGSIVVELGDTYSGSGGAGGDYTADGLRDGQPTFRQGRGAGWPLPKSLCGIPTLYPWSLAYGRNLLRPERLVEPWRVRNVVAWVRPNPPVGALGDKFRPATSYLTVACVSSSRYFDLDAVRHHNPRVGETAGAHVRSTDGPPVNGKGGGDYANPAKTSPQNAAGAPPLDWWEIPTAPYRGAHYAAFPEALVVRPIESMCPRRVCRTCGEPSRRIVATERVVSAVPDPLRGGGFGNRGDTARTTLGWSDCGHDDYRPGVVLDPFAGSGTTLAVAAARGRDAIGIDLDARNADLARNRVGLWMVEG
jgi:site-specific DNA-methyltransferase (adenine-specific)